MSQPSGTNRGESGGGNHVVGSDTRWGHRNLGGAWWLLLLLVPLLLAALLTALRGGAIGDDLRGRALAELKGAGYDSFDVDASGRDLTLQAADGASPTAADLDQAEALVERVDGVRVVSLSDDLQAIADGDGTGTDAGDGTDTGTGTGTGTGDADCDPATVQGALDAALGEDFVQFGEGEFEPTEASLAEITSAATVLAPCADLTVTVTGYTDKNGTEKKSQQRADRVAELLTEGGVTASITAVGGHFDQELGDNDTVDGRDLNRFATITVE